MMAQEPGRSINGTVYNVDLPELVGAITKASLLSMMDAMESRWKGRRRWGNLVANTSVSRYSLPTELFQPPCGGPDQTLGDIEDIVGRGIGSAMKINADHVTFGDNVEDALRTRLGPESKM